MKCSNDRSIRAFSLVEVVLALAVFSLGILALLQLMGSLLGSLRESRADAFAGNLLGHIGLERPPANGDGGFARHYFCRVREADRAGKGTDRLLAEHEWRALFHAGAKFEEAVFELRGHPPDGVEGMGSGIVLVEVRSLAPPAPGADADQYLARFRVLEPRFTFPLSSPTP